MPCNTSYLFQLHFDCRGLDARHDGSDRFAHHSNDVAMVRDYYPLIEIFGLVRWDCINGESWGMGCAQANCKCTGLMLQGSYTCADMMI